MDEGRLKLLPAVRRKPLPTRSTLAHEIGVESRNEDLVPLVDINRDAGWPLPGIRTSEGDYQTTQNEHRYRLSQFRNYGNPTPYNKGGQYSKLTATADDHYDGAAVSKDKYAAQNSPYPGHGDVRGARMWNSNWTHAITIGGFILIFIALLVGLVILWHFASVDNGISTRITDNHYAWTYGPTAVLVVVGVAWRQVDVTCRILAPWKHLRAGISPAHSSLLLDYVTPILPHMLIIAANEKDWAVLASGIGTLLMRVVIVFSTGLLVLTPTTLTRTTSDAAVNSTFVGTNYTVDQNVRDTEVMQYYGIKQHGMEYPYGTTELVAFDTLDVDSLLPNATAATTVHGIFPFFRCEIVQPKIVNFTWIKDGYPLTDSLKLNMTMSSKACPAELILFPNLCKPTSSSSPCPLGRIAYSEDQWYTPDFVNPNVFKDDLDPCANLYKLGIIELNVERIEGPLVNTSAAWNITLTNSTGILCTVGYTVDTVNITLNTMNPTSAGNLNVSGPLDRVMDVLPGFSYTNLTNTFQNQATLFGLETSPNSPHMYGYAKLFARLNGDSDVTLLDPVHLKSIAETTMTAVGVQFVNKYLRQATSSTTDVVLTFQDQRLQLRAVSVWAMGAGFALLVVVAVFVLVWRPQDVLSRSPYSLTGYAAILASSHSLQQSLASTGTLSDHEMSRYLASTTAFSTVKENETSTTFAVEIDSGPESSSLPQQASNTEIAWWRPISIRFWFVILVILLPAGAIVALEVLQRTSNANNGLTDISPTSLVAHSLPLLLASLVLILIATMYEAIEFAATTLAPFQTLASGDEVTKHTKPSQLATSSIMRWTTLPVYIRHRVAAISTFAAITGAFLTIIASGLYTIEDVPLPTNANILTLDKFVPTFNSSTDGEAGAVFNLIEHNNASYPALTYDELAFPGMILSDLPGDVQSRLQQSKSVMVHSRIPAMRASLNCTFVSTKDMSRINSVYKDSSCPSSLVTINASLPDSCPRFLSAKNTTTTHIHMLYDAQYMCSNFSEMSPYRAAMLSSQDGVFLDAKTGTTLGVASNPPECPSLAFISGYWVINSTSTDNITAMTCIQGLEEVQVDTILDITSESVQIRSAPIVDESSARWLLAFNSSYWVTQYAYFDDFLVNSENVLDQFYQSVSNGPDGVPSDELVGPANADRFFSATQHTYRRWMAQLISNTMRQNLSDAEIVSGRKYSAIIANDSILRLKQNTISKLILQILLGVMIVCGIFIYLWRDMRHVLPHSPNSIAGKMSLLAGSEMMVRKIMPPGAEFMDDKELVPTIGKYPFSLGWWKKRTRGDYDGRHEQDEQMRFGIDIGKADFSLRKSALFRERK